MSRTPAVLLLALLVAAACQQPAGSSIRSPDDPLPSPSIAPGPPLRVRLRPPGEALLSDQAVGGAHRDGRDHLTALEAASTEPDQAAALTEFTAWGWLDGASRIWSSADVVIVRTSRTEGAARAFAHWGRQATAVPYAAGACSAEAGAALDDCLLATSGERAVIVGRLGPAVFRIRCPAAAAERLTLVQAASLLA